MDEVALYRIHYGKVVRNAKIRTSTLISFERAHGFLCEATRLSHSGKFVVEQLSGYMTPKNFHHPYLLTLNP